jgi:hypothetical protein
LFCQQCGAANAQGDAFCSRCGAALTASAPAAACARCGTPALPGQGFCQRCGAPLSASAASPAVGGQPVVVRRRRSVTRMLFMGCLWMILISVALAVAAVVAYRNGVITKAMLLDVAGLGPAYIEIDNFRDDAIQVSIVGLAGSKDSKPAPTVVTITPFNVSTYRAAGRGRYRVDFRVANAGTLGTCALAAGSGDQYQFVALPDHLVVNRVNRPPSVGSDLVVPTSRLCR